MPSKTPSAPKAPRVGYKTKKYCLIGTAPSAEDAPVHDPSFTFVGLNGIANAKCFPRMDRWYQIHRLAGEPGYRSVAGEHSWWDITKIACGSRLERYEAMHDPRKEEKQEPPEDWMLFEEGEEVLPEVYMFWAEADIEQARPYPVEYIQDKYGTFFQTSSFSWALAHLIDELREDAWENDYQIHLYGVDMEFGTEYYEQRDGMQHFMDLGKQLGIPITMPVTSGLAYQPIPYPFWEADPHLRKLLKQQEVETEAQKVSKSVLRALETTVAAMEMAVQVCDMTDGPKELRAKFSEQLNETKGQLKDAEDSVVARKAILDHIEWHIHYLKGCGGS